MVVYPVTLEVKYVAEAEMGKNAPGPTIDARVIQLTQEHFGTTEEAREALRRAVAEIPDDQLRYVRGIRVLIMA
jgi:hypothetical protein